MPIARIEDIAGVMRLRADGDDEISIIEVGAKPGEKMYEELMNDEEVRRTYEDQSFYIVLSPFADKSHSSYEYLRTCVPVNRPYNSALELARNY
jgi:FlaA1/EpsC-like NDP-sugar epimerase